ncbi:DNA polymerase IV [Pseudonocardia sp. Ae168_Ps1]|uniref:Y-family DNA polymerase n=1 Tax=unclassified Pseudonocardia TaxID=2619320 RepID=UPI0009603EB6|nr:MULTISPECIES: DNA polymerase IV [unclassified Pseudonocardia]OLL71387.1 DNA polymerase IV [Pseudonocardia sp. Ae168_Ps1]OLL77066.1 DNA polymerase IV [Pseudonocardia sp. Ae150A_Ps1]OLL88823.1 DNA polymerase IV [Pseudonocardia sp. Ae263_Ps1]OLL91151.1 DNA polymerase IV [Pseudonocardia sp. Ae356_Ps1]
MFVRGLATILHADLDSFYAAVEQRDDPRLRGRPVIVGGGVVLAASYEARAFGVRTAMNGGQARAHCPGVIVVPPRMAAYSEASRAVFAIFRDTTPEVEGLSIDEAFLEVGGLARIAGTPREVALVSFLGPASGRHLHALAHLRDPRPVDTHRSRRSIGSQRALGRRPRTPEELDAILAGTVDRLARRLRAPRETGGGRVCRTVVLRLRFGDFARVTRSHTLPVPTAHTPTILTAARRLLVAATPEIRDRGITLLGLSLTNLDRDDAVQLELPLDAHAGPALDTALDEVRRRFGASSVSRATQLGRDQGLQVPLLPEHE